MPGGDAVTLAQLKAAAPESVRFMDPSGSRFVLFPCWEIKGLDTENNEWQAAVNRDWGNPAPTREDALDKGLRNAYDFVYQLRLHGQTGDVIGYGDLVYPLEDEPK